MPITASRLPAPCRAEIHQVQRLLATRADIFDDYTPAGFEAAFGQHYETVETQPIRESVRTLYLFRRKRT